MKYPYGDTWMTNSSWGDQPMPTMAELAETIKKYSRAVAEIPISQYRGCTHCGSWKMTICECVSKAYYVPAVCYVCGVQHDPRVQAPRVCEPCRKLYL